MIPNTPAMRSLDWGTKINASRIDLYLAQPGERFDGTTAEGFNAFEQGQIAQIIAKINTLIATPIVLTNTRAGAELVLVLDTNELAAQDAYAYMNPPGDFNAGIGALDGSSISRVPGGDMDKGGYAYSTINHELLHGLGLAHAHDDGGTSTIMQGVPTEDDTGTGNLNQGIYTIMSYNAGWATGPEGNQTNFDYGMETMPMALDTAILQNKYGANTSTNTGDNVYYLENDNAQGSGWELIWDNGGRDEIRAAADFGAIIDLRTASLQQDFGGGGYASRHEGIAGGYTIAHGVRIENAFGAGGDDRLIGNALANTLGGAQGADEMSGRGGNDTYVVDNTGDQITGEIGFANGGGIDTVRSFINYTTPDNIEILRLFGAGNLNGTGNDAPGTLVGNGGRNILTGRGGNDQINGNGGADTLIGNTGRDTMVGGGGADTFVYTSLSDSRSGAASRDVINTFDRGFDVIDLSAIDANLGLGGDAAFSFIDRDGFSGTAGELRLQGLGGANAVLIEADLRGDGVADLQIFVNRRINLDEADFIF